jgi:mRNA-degrading endonuclease RelE of RelBE toxin-antitoxin system
MAMPYDIQLSDSLQKKIRKLHRKDPQYYEDEHLVIFIEFGPHDEVYKH